MALEISSGSIRPLGATLVAEDTVNFAVFSQHATAIDLCLFDEEGVESRVRMTHGEQFVWSSRVKGISAGQRYGFRAHGPWDPKKAQLFNPAKLLIDPYARQLDSPTPYHPSMLSLVGDSADRRDSAPHVSKSVVYDGSDYDWEGDVPLHHLLRETFVYETHVKGFSKRNPNVPEEIRGTYAGLAHEASTNYLQDLGVTAIQLLPVHQHLEDGFLLDRGLVNYWGYNSIGFFAPETGYAATPDPVREFKDMVKALHRADIEVILDVVYNHTGETGPNGPTVFLRGLDNQNYYRLSPKQPEFYWDVTGCGNTLNVPHRRALQLTIDSLRYWVEEMHVDGFRFDLAVTMGREPLTFNRESAFFKAILQDPVLSKAKMIAEPWDLGRGGYQVGGFPSDWRELNGKFRDCVRRFWKGDSILGEFATRIMGSQDCYGHSGRSPLASFNFITSHDGFTLNDLVSYNEKHNEANGEGNRDGDSHNISYNHGVEGPTDDPEIIALRERQRRNFLTTLFISQGVPFLLGGDELGRTQGGNNNGYCQDSEISWFDWEKADTNLYDFVKQLVKFRQEHAVLRKRRFFTGNIVDPDTKANDVMWFCPSATVMKGSDWQRHSSTFSVVIHRDAGLTTDRNEAQETLLLVFNARDTEEFVTLPGSTQMAWRPVLDTETTDGIPSDCSIVTGGHQASVIAKSVHIWQLEGSQFDPGLIQKPKTTVSDK